MTPFRIIWNVVYGAAGGMVAFETEEAAQTYSQQVHGTVQAVRVYLNGLYPKRWTVHVGYAHTEGSTPDFWTYDTSELDCGPLDNAELIEDIIAGHSIQAYGTDEAQVRKSVLDWFHEQARADAGTD